MHFLSLFSALLMSGALAAPLRQLDGSTLRHDIVLKKRPGKDDSDSSSDADSKSDSALGKLANQIKDLRSGTGQKVRSAIHNLDKEVVALGQRIERWHGDAFEALALLNAAEDLVKHIKAGTDLVRDSPEISFVDGIAILPMFASFTPHTKRTMAILEAKRPEFEKAEVTGVVLEKIQAIQAAGTEFDRTVVDKLGVIEKPFGLAVYHPVDKAIGKGVEFLKAPFNPNSTTTVAAEPVKKRRYKLPKFGKKQPVAGADVGVSISASYLKCPHFGRTKPAAQILESPVMAPVADPAATVPLEPEPEAAGDTSAAPAAPAALVSDPDLAPGSATLEPTKESA